MIKKTLLPVILILLTAGVISSCQKEYAPGDVLDPVVQDSTGTVTGDSIYLDRISILYDNGIGVDTQEVFNFKYDSRKRLVEMHDSTLAHPGTEAYYDFYYFYNGNDTLPYKSVFVNNYDAAGTTTDTRTTFHYYDAAGRKVKDSVLSVYVYPGGGSTGSTVQSFVFDGNKMYGSAHSSSNSGLTAASRDTAMLDARGNILSSKQYLLDETTNTYELESSSTFTYDAHPHPFSKLSNFKSLYNFPNGETLYTEYAGFNNTLTQIETNQSSSGGWNIANTYTYYPSGLPATMMSDYHDGDPVKTVFKYKSL